MRRQIIAVDIDDVLSASAEGFAVFSNKRWNHNIKPDDYLEDWAEVWQVSADEARVRAEEFHKSGIVSEFRHFEHAVPVLSKLDKKYDIVVVTSRRLSIKPETERWIERYFPNIFKDICYAGIWDGDQDDTQVSARLKRTKTDACRAIGVNFLIDDQTKHCISAARAGIEALSFGDYRWNRGIELPEGVTPVRDWPAVERYFDAKS
ncbi:MAG TPA: hypothetical protein VMR45_00315 [Patescibacteria group bacterium]|jgi:hypothetical protein|nr:hypothetical protein [Patescibacteria group bacterium]